MAIKQLAKFIHSPSRTTSIMEIPDEELDAFLLRLEQQVAIAKANTRSPPGFIKANESDNGRCGS